MTGSEDLSQKSVDPLKQKQQEQISSEFFNALLTGKAEPLPFKSVSEIKGLKNSRQLSNRISVNVNAL